MLNGTTTQSLVFKARMQAKETLKEKRAALEEWDDKTNETMAEVLYYERVIELNDTPEIEHNLANAYRKHERACRIYDSISADIHNIEKAIDNLETAEWLLDEEW